MESINADGKNLVFDLRNAESLLNRGWSLMAKKLRKIGPSVFLVEAESIKYVIKRHSAHCTVNAEVLEKIYAAVEESGFTPSFIPGNSGEILYRQDQHLYSLQKYCPRTDKKLSPNEAGIWLAEMHQSLSGIHFGIVQNHFDREVRYLPATGRIFGLDEAVKWLEIAASIDGSRQIVHGDLHPGNFIISASGPLAIDFDSATTKHPGFDAGFLSYRLYGPDSEAMGRLTQAYSTKRPGWGVEPKTASLMLLFAVVQRIAFIRSTALNGCKRWLYDLENQKKYYRDALHMISSSYASETKFR